jgi:pimeloyl-ACP methyl ester carboxylesterase
MASSQVSDLRSIRVSGCTLAVRISGCGSPIVLVHGSLDDHRSWQRVTPYLSHHYQVVCYDRRGHGHSTCPQGQGTINQDREDLAALLRALDLEAPLVVGHSYGASIALLLGAHSPELTGGLLIHEPPLFTVLLDDERTRPLAEQASQHLHRAAALITQGSIEEGVRFFVDNAAFGPSTWDTLFTPEIRQIYITHADTWLDQSRDPERLSVRPELLANYPHRIMISHGDAGPPAYGPITEILAATIPTANRHIIRDAGHAPHLSHPEEFAALIRRCAQQSNLRSGGSGVH